MSKYQVIITGDLNELPFTEQYNGLTWKSNMKEPDLFNANYISICVEKPKYSMDVFEKYTKVIQK